jgi:hypothetical protein
MYKLRGNLKFRNTCKINIFKIIGSIKNISTFKISRNHRSYVNFMKFKKNSFSEKLEEKKSENQKETFATKQEFGSNDEENALNMNNHKNEISSENKTISPDIMDFHLQNKYSYSQMRHLMVKIDGSIEQNTYTYKNKLTPNFFGQNLLYFSSSTIPYKYLSSNVEFSGVITLSIISILNWYSLIFPSQYLFNYLILTTALAYSKLIWRLRFINSFIYQVSLLDEENLKLTYINGEIEVVPIKNIYLSNKMRDLLVLQDNTNSQPIKQFLPLEVRVNGRKDSLIILQNSVKFITHVELEPLLAVLHKETRKIKI